MLCVIAKLNEEATEKLMSIRTAALSDAALKPLHGHITIASYTGNHGHSLSDFANRFCRELPPLRYGMKRLRFWMLHRFLWHRRRNPAHWKFCTGALQKHTTIPSTHGRRQTGGIPIPHCCMNRIWICTGYAAKCPGTSCRLRLQYPA